MITTIHNCLLSTWNVVIVIKNWILTFSFNYAFLVAQMVKNLPAMQETQVQFLGQEDPLEKEMATDSSILAWRIPWTEEPGGLQSMVSKRVGHGWAIFRVTLRGFPYSSVGKESTYNAGDRGLSLVSGRSPGEGKGNLLQYSCLGNPMDRGAWWATPHGVIKELDMTEWRTLSTFTF